MKGQGLITREGVWFYHECFYIFSFFYDALSIDTIDFCIGRILFFRDRWAYFRDLEELRNDPVSLPFEDRIKETALRKS